MPIKVTCQCGKSLAAKDELAGKLVKCPGCQQALRIPAATASAAAASAAKAPGGPASKPQAPAVSSRDGTADLFDEIGLTPQVAGSRPCPGCAAPLPPEAVVCIKCGYNIKLGRRMETVKVSAEDHLAGGHSMTTADLLDKASKTLQEDKAEEEKKGSEGLPWWVYMVALAVLAGFLGTMMVLANLAEMKPKEEKAGSTRRLSEALLAKCASPLPYGSPAGLEKV